MIDTAKAANLYLCHPEEDFLAFVNAPIGRGKPVYNPVRPLIAGELPGSKLSMLDCRRRESVLTASFA